MDTTEKLVTEFDTIKPSPAVAGMMVPKEAAKEDMNWLSIPEDKMLQTLKASLYPGASNDMVIAVMEYCRAARLNIMLKPVHIVPMFIPKKDVERDGQKVTVEGTGVMRDIIMPGINHYRVQASRSGVYLGKTPPEWGPTIKLSLSPGTNQQGVPNGPDIVIEVPEYCRITVFKLVGGYVVPFTAEEYWIENYATQSRYSKVPNAMWMQRPRGQLGKVTEAQALRQAFPELCGGETAEEMAGKAILEAEVGADGTVRVRDIAPKSGAKDALDTFASRAPASDMKQAKRSSAKQGGKDKPAVDGPVDDGVIPSAPPEALAAFKDNGDFEPAWKWINETMPKLGPKTRQGFADSVKSVLWAVYHKSDSYRKAVEEFVEAMGVKVDE